MRRPTSSHGRGAPFGARPARTPTEYEQLRADRRAAFEYLATGDEHRQAAIVAERKLARIGRYRAVGIADLLTAVLAARHRLTSIHYDADFDIVAEVLEFEAGWVVDRGSVP